MRNVDVIINLDVVLNHSIVKRAATDRRQTTNLDIVTNDNCAKVNKPNRQSVFIPLEPKTILANNGTGLHNAALTNNNTVSYNYIVMNNRICPYRHTIAENNSAPDFGRRMNYWRHSWSCNTMLLINPCKSAGEIKSWIIAKNSGRWTQIVRQSHNYSHGFMYYFFNSVLAKAQSTFDQRRKWCNT